MEKIVLWTINAKKEVTFDLIEAFDGMNSTFFNKIHIYTSTNKKESLEIINRDIWKKIIQWPSTNGVYSIPGFFILTKENGRHPLTSINKFRKQEINVLISTKRFLSTYLSDINLNTTTAMGKFFFKGKNINPKLFIKKHLLMHGEPSLFNDIKKLTKTINDIILEETSRLKVSEIRTLLDFHKQKNTGKKNELLKRLNEFNKNSINSTNWIEMYM
ncbi:MAG: SAP domain-containing protein [Mycoplasmataceae bacterium]|nr:SAP domain-containing protein [Mycoplasmataceae bacterium]